MLLRGEALEEKGVRGCSSAHSKNGERTQGASKCRIKQFIEKKGLKKLTRNSIILRHLSRGVRERANQQLSCTQEDARKRRREEAVMQPGFQNHTGMHMANGEVRWW